ncbi:hypothetical protein ACTRW9_09750 [Nitrospina sp. 32_T5]|uniref:hypothetical protein n=1 Tax=unclassified Nitrospina TaxID=2638683 RepID=UPI003F96BF9D
MIISGRPKKVEIKTTRTGQQMGRVLFQTENEFFDVTIWPELWERNKINFKKGEELIIHGNKEFYEDRAIFIAEDVTRPETQRGDRQ